MVMMWLGCCRAANAQSADSLRRNDLQTVTVNAARPAIITSAGKIVLNVSASPIAAGGDALQLVSHAPGVIDQGAGNFELRGKRVTVLVDGKDNRLSGEELRDWLSAMPAGSIDRIELITNPPARYDARGAAVINIITLKSRNFGTNGTFTAGLGAGRYTRYTAGLGLNHRNEKVNLYGNYDYQYNKQYYDQRSSRILDNSTRIAETSWDTRRRNNHSLRGGLDYEISARSSAGIMVKALLNYRYRAVHTLSVMDHASTEDSFSTVNTNGDLRVLNPSVNIYYKTMLDTNGKQLTVNADYFNFDKSWSDDYLTNFYAPGARLYAQPYHLRDNSPATNTIKSIAADYVQPLWKGKLEAGAKATFTTTDNDIQWQELREKEWKTDSGKTNHFIYRENIYAAYLSYSRTIKKLDLQAGLRAEQTYMEGVSLTLQQKNNRDQLDLFPSLVLLYNQSEKHQYGFAYRKSIERFSFHIVNPFVTYVSQYFYYQGNPNIRPSIGNALELSYTYNQQLFVTASYQHYTYPTADIYRKDTANVVIGTSLNLSGADAFNTGITYAKAFLRSWMSTNTLMMTYARYNENGSGQLSNSGAGLYVNTSNNFAIIKGLSAELSASYYSPMAFGVYKMKSRYTVDAGISKNILHNAARLTFNVTDIFNSLTTKYDVASFGVISSYENKVESRFFRLVFSYKFGNQRVKAAGSRRSGIEKEQRRMEGN
jgi:hypothetical protein